MLLSATFRSSPGIAPPPVVPLRSPEQVGLLQNAVCYRCYHERYDSAQSSNRTMQQSIQQSINPSIRYNTPMLSPSSPRVNQSIDRSREREREIKRGKRVARYGDAYILFLLRIRGSPLWAQMCTPIHKHTKIDKRTE